MIQETGKNKWGGGRGLRKDNVDRAVRTDPEAEPTAIYMNALQPHPHVRNY